MKNNIINLKLRNIFLLFFLIKLTDTIAQEADYKPYLNLSIEGKTLQIETLLPTNTIQFELRIESSRNDQVTRFSTISPHDPDAKIRAEKYNRIDGETWFPVVDITPEAGMEGICVFKGNPSGTYVAGGPFYRDEHPLSKEIIFPNGRLEYWENSLQVSSKTIELEKFYLRKTYPVLLHEFRHTIKLLSEDWSGKVSIYVEGENGLEELISQEISSHQKEWHHTQLESLMGKGLEKERLLTSLETLIEDGLRRQNNNPNSPTYGSFHTFYDFDAKLHRTSYWLWGGSPIVKMITDAIQIPEIEERMDTEALLEAVDKTGKLYLKNQVREKGHPSRGSFLVIWTRKPGSYTKWVGTSDSGIMHKWAIIPLFKATGDSAYLESAEFWCAEKGKLLKDKEILPHFYLYDQGKFNDKILDETGWDPEGHAALYQVTKNEAYRQVALEYMDKHMAKFQTESGIWNRNYSISEDKASPPSNMTRGTGWAMEGMLAMNEMFPDSIYLEYAEKMAAHLVKSQQPDGSWNFVFDIPEGHKLAITTEKGTPLWSLLFYRLYQATKNEQYLSVARKALNWCLENQYTGPDPEAIGGLVGRTNASMVGYRYYYDATCAYAIGFFGLAILEELKMTHHQEKAFK